MRIGMLLALGLLLGGCVTPAEINRANLAMDAEWGPENQYLFRTDGRRRYQIDRDTAIAALEATMRELRLTIRRRDAGGGGSLIGEAVAPRPLTDAEWDAVAEAESARMRAVIAREVGPLSSAMFVLAPRSYALVFAVAIGGGASETELAITASMRHVAPQYGIRYPENIPPEAARRGVTKFWATFEETLRAKGIDPIRVAPAAPARTPTRTL